MLVIIFSIEVDVFFYSSNLAWFQNSGNLQLEASKSNATQELLSMPACRVPVSFWLCSLKQKVY